MWEIEDARDFIAKLKTLINFRSFFLNQNLRKEERLLEKTQEIIHKINELDN